MTLIVGTIQKKLFSNTSKSVVFGWFNVYASKKFAKNFDNVYIFGINVLG